MGAHSQNSPSSFKRRKLCPGSRAMEAKYPDKENPHSRKGSAVHHLAETCLLNGNEPEEFLGEVFEKWPEFPVDEGMIAGAKVHVDYCAELIANAAEYSVEEKFDLPFLGKGEKGTADFVALHGGILEVVDYKNGIGYVDADENEQGICYGLGAAKRYHNLDWDTLKITIVQPNAIGKQPIRSWEIPRHDVIDWLLDFQEAAEKTFEPDAPLIPGEAQCQWCKARADCPALQKLSIETAQESFDVVDDLSAGKIGEIWPKLPMMKQFISAVEERGFALAMEGKPPPGTKVVEGKARRYWKDEAAARKRLTKYGLDDKDMFSQSFKSPAQIEKTVGKKQFEAELADELVEKRSSGLTLVSDDDPRPPAKISAADTFETVE
jgi:hypothetical protein